MDVFFGVAVFVFVCYSVVQLRAIWGDKTEQADRQTSTSIPSSSAEAVVAEPLAPPPLGRLSLEGHHLELNVDEIISRLTPPPLDLTRASYKGPISELWRRPAREAMNKDLALYGQACDVQYRSLELLYKAAGLHHEAVDTVDRMKHESLERKHTQVEWNRVERGWKRDEGVQKAESDLHKAQTKRALDELLNALPNAPEKSAAERRAEARDRRWVSFLDGIENEADLKKRAEAAKILYPELADEIERRLADYLINLRERG